MKNSNSILQKCHDNKASRKIKNSYLFFLLLFLFVMTLALGGCARNTSPVQTSSTTTEATANTETTTTEIALSTEEAHSTIDITTPQPSEVSTEPIPSSTEEISEAPTTTSPLEFTDCVDTVYTISRLNLRSEPSTNASIITILPFQATLERIGIAEGWSKVMYEGNIGYVSSDYISTIPPLEETTETPVPETPPSQIPDKTITRVETATGILYTGNSGPLIAIDAGHQKKGNNDLEPLGPGSSETKKKVSYGTSGCVTGLAESLLNLAVGIQLRDALLAQGYNVLMIRETQEVNISNSERATYANSAGASAFIRIHANGSTNSEKEGTLTVCPTTSNPFLPSDVITQSIHLSQIMVDSVCALTGSKNLGLYRTDSMSGINWCTIPVTILEMGYMSNPEEDTLLSQADYQAKIVQGVCNAFNIYFNR